MPVLEKRRPNGEMPVPQSFYVILVDTTGRQDKELDILAMEFGQDTPRDEEPSAEHIRSIDELEGKTKLNFFPRLTAGMQKKNEKERVEEVWAVEGE